MNTKERLSYLYQIAFIPILVVVFFLMLYAGVKFLLPFLLAWIIAFVSEPLTKWLIRKGVKRYLASAASLIFFYSITLSLLGWGLLIVAKELIDLGKKLPQTVALADQIALGVLAAAKHYSTKVPDVIAPYILQVSDQVGRIVMQLAEKTGKQILSMVTSLPVLAIIIVFTILASYFILRDKDAISAWMLSFFSDNNQSKIKQIGTEILSSTVKYLKAQFILMGITFVVSLAGLLLAGMPYALTASICIALVDIIPVLGPGVILIPWALFFFITGDMPHGSYLLIIYAILFLARQFLQPKILAETMELPALPLLVSIYVGMIFFGVPGLILAPFVLVVYEAIHKVQKEKKFVVSLDKNK